MTVMKVLIRVDSSTHIGIGHVMRCLTLARALRPITDEIVFLCRISEGDISGHIERSGFAVARIGLADSVGSDVSGVLGSSQWLQVSQADDARDCLAILNAFNPDLTIVDHYGLDATWHRIVSSNCKRIAVIDDLANRNHYCDILIDQTYGRDGADYIDLVPPRTKLLIGSRFALLRPEFSLLREASLKRRTSNTIKRVIVSMGGVDKDDYAGKILSALAPYVVPQHLEVHIVMGSTSPHLDAIKDKVAASGERIRLSVDLDNMAEAMMVADLAIGAAGSTSWERCCMGLPTIMFVVAENQRKIAANLEAAGAALVAEHPTELGAILFGNRGGTEPDLVTMSSAAAAIIDGEGAIYTAQELASYEY